MIQFAADIWLHNNSTDPLLLEQHNDYLRSLDVIFQKTMRHLLQIL